MQIIDNIIILSLPILAFLFGKYVSDSYNNKIIDNLDEQLRVKSIEQGIGYVAPPTKKIIPIGQDFMDRLKENGHAVQQIKNGSRT